MQVIARLIELKPGSTDRVREWAKYLNERRAAAEETLRAEGVEEESWFAVSLHGKDYLLCYMRADSMERAAKVASESASPVDAYHRQFKVDTWIRDAGAVGELRVDLSAARD